MYGFKLLYFIYEATTVASTMRLAHMAGIATFVTGGIGGVHRGAEDSMDISADLVELSRTPVVVVSAGIKSILDIGRTLEQLETLGVPTAAFQTDEFPAFFSPQSGVATPTRVNNAEEVARAYWASQTMRLPNGMLIAVPNADPAGETVELAIHQALKEAEDQQIIGRDVTPFILKRVAEKTGGDSLKSNTLLVKNNAKIGADIATSIASLATETRCHKNYQIITPNMQSSYQKNSASGSQDVITSPVLVVGGSVNDIVAKPTEGNDLISFTSNPGNFVECDGGVGRNVAEVLGRLGAKPLLFSAVGSDARGKYIIEKLQMECGVKCSEDSIPIVNDHNTATYLAVLDGSGDLHVAIADMKVFESIPMPSEKIIAAADYVVIDANPNIEYLKKLSSSAAATGAKVCFEPTSIPKASICGKDDEFVSNLTYIFPNVDELLAMSAVCDATTANNTKDSYKDNNFSIVKSAASNLLERMRSDSDAHLIITMGSDGVLLASRMSKLQKEPTFRHFAAAQGVDVQNCTGAGDTLCGAFMKGLLDGNDEAHAIEIGMDASLKSLKCANQTISPDL